jgi:hypothetical protein
MGIMAPPAWQVYLAGCSITLGMGDGTAAQPQTLSKANSGSDRQFLTMWGLYGFRQSLV